jgi:serine/threonine protein phosphatase PrpC
MIPDDPIAATLASAGTCKLTCERLVEQALDAGGKDNITVAVARYRIHA